MPKLLDEVRDVLRMKHYSIRTEKAYVSWIKRYIFFHNKQHPLEMGEPQIRAFISDLASKQQVSASTQTVALSALLFLYRDVLKKDLPFIDGIERAKRPERLPVVFTKAEVKEVLARLDGVNHLIAALLYGSGMRLMDALRLRVKDIDFELTIISTRKGDKIAYHATRSRRAPTAGTPKRSECNTRTICDTDTAECTCQACSPGNIKCRDRIQVAVCLSAPGIPRSRSENAPPPFRTTL